MLTELYIAILFLFIYTLILQQYLELKIFTTIDSFYMAGIEQYSDHFIGVFG